MNMYPIKFLQVEPTTRCNFTCKFCCGRHMEQADINIETYKTVLEMLPELKHVELQGEGEPLMHPDFLSLLEIIRSRGVKVSFITNGSMLSNKISGFLLDAEINKIYVSIESADEKTFSEIRGGKLSKVVGNIKYLMAERTRRGLKKPAVGFSINVLSRTYDDLQPIFSLYNHLGLDGGLNVQALQQMSSYTSIYDDEMRSQILTDAQTKELWTNLDANSEYLEILRSRNPVNGFYDELFKGRKIIQRSCPWLEKGIYINHDGNITPCCMIKDSTGYGFGNIMDDGFEKYWILREAMRAQLKSKKVPEPCIGCGVANYAVMPKFRYLVSLLKKIKSRCC